MSTKVASMYAEITAKSDGLKAGLNDAKSQVNGMKASFGSLKASALMMSGIVTGSLGAAVKAIYDMGSAGAQIELVEGRFDRLSQSIGTTSEALFGDLKKATNGLMSDSELMASATDLMALGLVKTHDEAVRLTSVAGQLGMNMNQLVLTLTNQTTMRFDALGVSVDGFDEKVNTLKKSGLDANEAFSEAFLQQAEEQIKNVGSIADTTAGSFMELKAEWGNFVDEIKKSASGPVGDIVKLLTKELSVRNELNDAVEKGVYTQAESNKMYNKAAWGAQTYDELLKQIDTDTRLVTIAENERMLGFGPYQQGLVDFGNAAVEAAESEETLIDAEEAAAIAADQAAKAADQHKQTMIGLANANGTLRDRAAEAAVANSDLALALMGLDKAGIARQQIEQLSILLEQERITPEQYAAGFSDIAVNAGLTTGELIKFSEYLPIMNSLVATGVLETTNIDEAWQIWTEYLKTDATPTIDEMIESLETAGLTTQTTTEIMNKQNLEPIITATGELFRNVSGIANADKDVTFNYHIRVTTTGPIGLITTPGGTNITVGGNNPGGLGGWDGASGGSFIVPPGFPNDSFPINVQSGEHVQVTPAGQMRESDESIAILRGMIASLPKTIALGIMQGMARAENR